MRQLNWELKQLVDGNEEGAHATRRGRSYRLRQIANTLHDLGYRNMTARGVKPKHVEALVAEWKRQGKSVGTMKNYAGDLRWWATKVGKREMIPPDNAALGIGERQYVTNESKAQKLDRERLEKVTDPYVRMSLRLQEAFGLRREESIKFSPAYADRGSKIVLKGSWCKGGRPREVPLRTAAQRELLDEARQFVGWGAMIRPDRNYRAQRVVYDEQVRGAGFSKMHGLRHAYAQRRYGEETGWTCPALGGPRRRDLRGVERELDRNVRRLISEELGHGRIEVVAVYLGS